MKESKTMDEGALEEEVTLKGRIFALTMRLLALGLIVLSLMLSTEGLFVVILLFIIVVPFEKLFPGTKGKSEAAKTWHRHRLCPCITNFRDTHSHCWCFHCGD